ncbi:CHAT domain-containing protein [Actinoplanes sp. KI2]|uniref:CHAT domain-containing protein n=1 Tax=Actinoplanes sp. KI2 TaxID=2983315 RepID=UPI0021D5A34D|nr:CHAT domain-containing protein [Actinoplanes sp. KI2]MCU7728863.1 CHAT domain-containing protein [Actinoplanes sp. KI2]
MTDLEAMLDRTSAAITRVGAPDDAAWRFARCWMHVTRYDQDHAAADLSAALADFDGLPTGFPGRPKMASILVTAMIRAQLSGDPRAVALTAVANDDPRPLADWPATAAAVRARALLESSMHGGPGFNIRAAVHEVEGLAATAAGVRPQQDLVEIARIGLTMHRDFAEASPSEVSRMPGRIRELLTMLEGSGAADTTTIRIKGTAMAGVAEAYAAAVRGDFTAVAPEMRKAQEIIGGLPPGDPAHQEMADLVENFASVLDLNDSVTTAVPSPNANGNLASLRDRAAAPGLAPAERATRLHSLGFAEMGYGLDSDAMLDSAVEHLREAVVLAGEDDPRQAFYTSALGTALLRRVEMLAGRADLTEAIQLLEKARTMAGSELHGHWTNLSNPLAHAYRLAGQRARCREVALSGLRGHAWNVLLQSDTAAVQVAARNAAGDAMDVASWCIQDNDPESAAMALDAGRALILYAATETRDLAARMIDEGRPDLAQRWLAAPADAAEVSGELRREMISVIAHIPLDAAGTAQVPLDAGSARLLAPPDLNEVRAALTSLGVDALVYLMPGRDRSGAAVIVPAAEPPTWLPLPQLTRGWGAAFDAFLTAATRTSRRRDVDAAYPADAQVDAGPLEDLCERAWTAAIGPVLTRLPDASRIVLIPMGELVRIPWHAARRTVDGRWRYAIEDATFSYAPSARLLCDLAWRGAPPPAERCLIVADPDTAGAAVELSSARAEAWAIREAFYPAARYVGRVPDGSTGPDGAGTRNDVLSWLTDPGEAGALLHLACHGMVEPGTDTADTSYLLLSGGERLSAEEVVSSAARVGRPIALAVLGACSSGVCGRGDDEAFSLSTTLLANNVAAVVGTQWSVPDAATSVLMFMFHHYLRREGLPPAEALRRAQLWMITPDHQPPATMPAQLRSLTARSDPAAPTEWAAFLHFGR